MYLLLTKDRGELGALMKLLGICAAALLSSASAHAAVIPFSGTLSDVHGDGIFKDGDTFSGTIDVGSGPSSYYDPDTNGAVYSWSVTYTFSVDDAQYPLTYTNPEGELDYYSGIKSLSYFSPGDSLGDGSTMTFGATILPGSAGYPDLASFQTSHVPAVFDLQGLVLSPDGEGSGLYANATGNGIIGAAGTPIGAVPEFATWLMMILGFGAIGGVMRRVHRKSEEKFTQHVRSLATA